MYTTPEVCNLLSCTPAALNSWLSRHERYKPVQRTADGWRWTPEEVERLREARTISTARNRKKAKQLTSG